MVSILMKQPVLAVWCNPPEVHFLVFYLLPQAWTQWITMFIVVTNLHYYHFFSFAVKNSLFLQDLGMFCCQCSISQEKIMLMEEIWFFLIEFVSLFHINFCNRMSEGSIFNLTELKSKWPISVRFFTLLSSMFW